MSTTRMIPIGYVHHASPPHLHLHLLPPNTTKQPRVGDVGRKDGGGHRRKITLSLQQEEQGNVGHRGTGGVCVLTVYAFRRRAERLRRRIRDRRGLRGAPRPILGGLSRASERRQQRQRRRQQRWQQRQRRQRRQQRQRQRRRRRRRGSGGEGAAGPRRWHGPEKTQGRGINKNPRITTRGRGAVAEISRVG